jgi:hypothetical protein
VVFLSGVQWWVLSRARLRVAKGKKAVHLPIAGSQAHLPASTFLAFAPSSTSGAAATVLPAGEFEPEPRVIHSASLGSTVSAAGP